MWYEFFDCTILNEIILFKNSVRNHIANHAMQANRDLRQSPDPSIRHSIVVDASGGLMFPVGGVVRKGFSAHTAYLEMHRF